MNDIEEWVRAHDTRLAAGLTDDEIYDQLREHAISMDGQRSPLAGAPSALAQTR